VILKEFRDQESVVREQRRAEIGCQSEMLRTEKKDSRGQGVEGSSEMIEK
jgi:hypothetical protein